MHTYTETIRTYTQTIRTYTDHTYIHTDHTYIHTDHTYIHRPYVHTHRPYVHTHRPYVHTHKPYVHTLQPCLSSSCVCPPALQTRPDRRISVNDLLTHPWLMKNHGRPVDWRTRIDVSAWASVTWTLCLRSSSVLSMHCCPWGCHLPRSIQSTSSHLAVFFRMSQGRQLTADYLHTSSHCIDDTLHTHSSQAYAIKHVSWGYVLNATDIFGDSLLHEVLVHGSRLPYT